MNADVLIVGAGIIGSGIASALSRQGVDVALVDPAAGKADLIAGRRRLIVPTLAPVNRAKELRALTGECGWWAANAGRERH